MTVYFVKRFETSNSHPYKLLYSVSFQLGRGLYAFLRANVDRNRKVVHSAYSAHSGKVIVQKIRRLSDSADVNSWWPGIVFIEFILIWLSNHLGTKFWSFQVWKIYLGLFNTIYQILDGLGIQWCRKKRSLTILEQVWC